MAGGMAPPLAILGPQFAAFAIVAIFEHVYPYHVSWNKSHSDVSVDARHAVGIGILIVVITPPMIAIGVAMGGWLSDRFGVGLWPTEWPLLAQIALGAHCRRAAGLLGTPMGAREASTVALPRRTPQRAAALLA